MGSIVSQPPPPTIWRRNPLGSLGADETTGEPADLTTPTVQDPTAVWQADVLARLDAGVKTLQVAETQKWLQIAATLSIPLAAAVWKMIFKRGVSDSGV